MICYEIYFRYYRLIIAGGVFANQSFAFNVKCAIIALIGIILFVVPGSNLMTQYGWMASMVMLFWVFLFIYVGIAYYDHLYNCDPKLKQGTYSITRTFKPLMPSDTSSQLLQQERDQLKAVYLFHMFIVSPFLIYTSWAAYKVGVLNQAPNNFDIFSFYFTGIMGLIAGVYHSIRFVYPRV